MRKLLLVLGLLGLAPAVVVVVKRKRDADDFAAVGDQSSFDSTAYTAPTPVA